jgi:hypothetical protein
MNGSPTVLAASLSEAFAALENHRFIALCAGDLQVSCPKGDRAVRGNLTHVHGDAQVTYQLTMGVVEACADEHRVRYQLHAREQAGGSLATLTIDAALVVADADTLLALTPHLVLAGHHGGIPYPDLQAASMRALEVFGTRIADLLSDERALSSLASPRDDSDVPTGLAQHASPRGPVVTRKKGFAGVMAAAVVLAIAGSAVLRRRRGISRR